MEETVKSLSDCGKKSSEEIDPGESAGMERPRVGEGLQPLLVEEGTPACPPAHVARLLASIRAERQVQDDDQQAAMDELVGLLYVLAVETGFTPMHSVDPFSPGVSVNASNLRCISRMPSGWRRPQDDPGPRYRLDFLLGAAEDTWSARLLGVVCGDVLIANMEAAEPRDVAFSLGFAAVDGGDVRALARLARRFKDAVSVPVRGVILNQRGLCNASLTGLPYDLQLQLAAWLSPADLYHLALSCSCLSALLSDQTLWRRLVHRDLPDAFGELSAREVREAGAHQDAVDWRVEYRKRRPDAPPPSSPRPSQLIWRPEYPWHFPYPLRRPQGSGFDLFF